MGWFDAVKRGGLALATGGLSEQARAVSNPRRALRELDRLVPGEQIADAIDSTRNPFREVDPDGRLARESASARRFAGIGQQGFQQRGEDINATQDQLRRLSQGQDSFSAEQLRQGLQQQLSMQRSLAAGANPAGQSMAARTAAIQMGRQSSGLAGQQALAGIAERNAATGQLAQLQAQARQQDLMAALQSRQTAMQGLQGLEQARTGRFGIIAGQPTASEKFLGMVQGGLSAIAGMPGGGGGGGGAAPIPWQTWGPPGGY